MSIDKYSVTQYSVSSILGFIEAGDIAIPEIQRPFVWRPSQVRDLIDSLYHGYPTGYLIIWQNPSVKLKNGKDSVGKKILIDGQQRITALMTAISGLTILTEDFQEKVIKIAFNPLAVEEESRFEVQTPIHQKTKHWIPDISELFKSETSLLKYMRIYCERNPEVDESVVESSLTNLMSIKSCQLGAIVLVPQLDISEVTEIFVRINSQGKRLNESDFAMSKIAADEKYGGNMLRKAIDYFCHMAVEPSFYGQISKTDKAFMESEYESKMRWLKDDKSSIYDPDYGDMLRVSFMHTTGKGRLGDLVSLLSGRDFQTRSFREEIAEESFANLKAGILNFMNEYNFNNFVLAIQSAGYTTERLLSSQMTLNFAYTLYLMLSQSGEIPKNDVKRYVQKWFVLSTLTGRYVASSESQMDKDMRSISEKKFLTFFREAEDASLSDTFWTIGLVQNLETSSIRNPHFNTYIAAQIFFNDRSLLSNSSKVTDLISVMGDVHHIFPREYLKQNGIEDKSQYNQIANYAYLDTGVNISIGKKAPDEYFTVAMEQCSSEDAKIGTITKKDQLFENLRENCIPENIFDMTYQAYPDFLLARRKMMADKIHQYYDAL
ncbi:DUF262 domain-containing protein [Candidatus Saccharibacteria bacterium]|nr:DUF262 domain-containing protein [Candidatus Saccharibacteria bacterium]